MNQVLKQPAASCTRVSSRHQPKQAAVHSQLAQLRTRVAEAVLVRDHAQEQP